MNDVLDVPSDGLGTARTDVVELRQILLNLLGNAAKLTESGTVTLSVRRDGAQADRLVFAVADIGMTDGQVGALFQRFHQADVPTTPRFGGPGHGLALSKAFGTMLGGDLSVDSAPGQGSTFSLFVPAELADDGDGPASGAADARGGEPGARGVVLVIDDDPAQRDLMVRFLGREGFRAVTAPDGFAGLQLARTVKPTAILLDVTMPGLDGWSVLGALKADPEVADVPVVMVTCVDERGLASTLGAADSVMMPVRWETLKGVMERFRGEQGSVLVVEDDADMRHHARSVLERGGCAVTEAGDGREALALVAEAVPRVVLVDLDMPNLDGFGFLQTVRSMPGCAGVPVVVLTSRDLTRDDRRLLRGADQVLSKGVTSLADLSRELAEIAAQRGGNDR